MTSAIFSEPVTEYPGAAGLEYVAAAYEEMGAQADTDADPDNEALYQYWERAAYGEAFWAHQVFEQQQRRGLVRAREESA